MTHERTDTPNPPAPGAPREALDASTPGVSHIADYIARTIRNLHAYESYEMALPIGDRDEAVADWVIRCLANPDSKGSDDVLAAIAERRKELQEAS